MDARRDMTVGSEWKELLLFSLPIMAGQFLQQLYNTVDSIVVSRYGGRDAGDMRRDVRRGGLLHLAHLPLPGHIPRPRERRRRPRRAALRRAARDGAPPRGLDAAHNPGRAGRLPRRLRLAGRAGCWSSASCASPTRPAGVRDRVLRHLRRGARLPVRIQRRGGHTARRGRFARRACTSCSSARCSTPCSTSGSS